MQDFVACKVPFFGGTEPKLFLLKRETRKIVLVMKITAVLLLAAVLQVSAKSWGQEKITLSFNNAPLEQVLNSIHSQANVEFIYRTDYVKDKKVTVNVSNASLKTVLDLCLQNQQLTYDIFGKNVSIHPEKREGKDGKPSENLVSGVSGPGDVTGRVTDPQGEPIVGANVIIKRNGSGTITNANGQFTLKNVNTDDIIVISFVGYSPLSVKIGDKTNFLLVMNIAVNKLDAAVVQAYGKTTERLRTGNITTVTAKEIEQQPVMNVLQALQGKVPGLEITQSSGYASAPFKVEIRGRKYLDDLPPDPLIIVDGVPITIINFTGANANGSRGTAQSGVPTPIGGQSPLFNIDPNEIESVTVLKDADATAIYGSRGGSGVILITTKKGHSGAARFDVTYNSGFERNVRWFNLMNTRQYIEMRNEALRNDGLTPDISNAPDLVQWDTARYTNWQKFIYGGTGKDSKVDANVDGGDLYTKYRISMGYETRSNITTVSGANDRFSFSSNFSHNTPNNMFKFDLVTLYSYTKVNAVVNPTDAVLLPPNAPSIYNQQNKLNFSEWDPVSYFLDQFSGIFETYNDNTSYLNSRFTLTILPIKGLDIKAAAGYSTFDQTDKDVYPIVGQNPIYSPTGSLNVGTTKAKSIIFEPQAEYSYNLKKLKTSILVGSSFQSTNQFSIGAFGSGYKDDNLLNSISNAPTKTGSDATGQYKYFAVFGRMNFNLSDKYVVNLSARRDGSSKFGPGKQFGNFGSIGGAWIISSEKWFHPFTKIISFAKLRSSLGTVGSDNIAPYGYLTRWSGASNVVIPYGGSLAYIPTQHANPGLQWQQNEKLEVAGNLNFLNDKIRTDIAWYRDRTKNQLLIYPLPSMTGFPSVYANLPATVQNSGIEARLTIDVVNNNQFKLSANFNVTRNRNKLIQFQNIEKTSYANKFQVGESINQIYLYKFLGVDKNTGEAIVEDRDKDGVIAGGPTLKDPDAYTFDVNTKYYGGFGVDLSYKNISLSTFFTYANLPVVQKIFNSNTAGSFGPTSNQPVTFLNRWQNPGDIALYPSYTTQFRLSDINYRNSDAVYTKGNYISIQNISLAYSFSKKLCQKIKMMNANVFARTENVYMFTNYPGLDPRFGGLGSYPLPFTMVFGANLNF